MNAYPSHPFLVYRVIRRGERISQIRSEPAGQITSCFRIARIMKTCPFTIFRNILGNSRQLFGRGMLGKDRVECKHNGKALECMIACGTIRALELPEGVAVAVQTDWAASD